MLRYREPGYEEVLKPDSRRGLWVRKAGGAFEMCAGREGDDAHVKLAVGQLLTSDDLNQLGDLFRTLRYAVDLTEENDDE